MRQTAMNATRGDMAMLVNPALAPQPLGADAEISLYVDRRIALTIMVSNAQSMEY